MKFDLWRWGVGLGGVALLALTAALLSPALSGPFLQDDWVTLSLLDALGSHPDLEALIGYLFSGSSGPLGRPLSLATFLLNRDAWPADPAPFKLFNLLLHLLNGCLIYHLVRHLELFRGEQEGRVDRALALGVMALWLLHPLQLSTVMYVVQRMTELSTLCMLAGMIGHLRLRRRITADSPGTGGWLALNLIGWGGLAVLAKESGALLPLYLLVIEWTLLRRDDAPEARWWRWWKGLFLLLPTLLIVGYLSYLFRDPGFADPHRTFTLGERLLTQPRVLFSYLTEILLPVFADTALFRDSFPLSTGLFAPATTLPALAGVVLLILFGLWGVHVAPVAAFAILWFFAGQLLESTTVSLELYYTHRNYLPMLGPLIGLVYLACRLFLTGGKPQRMGVAGVAVLFLLLTLHATHREARIWGDPTAIAFSWLERHPDSLRTLRYSAALFAEQRPVLAQQLRDEAIRLHPLQPGAPLERLFQRCQAGTPVAEPLGELVWLAQHAEYDGAVFPYLKRLHVEVANGRCGEAGLRDLLPVVEGFLRNYRYSSAIGRYNLHRVLAEIYVSLGQLNGAMESLSQADQARPELEIAIRQGELLASAGLYQEAFRFLGVAEARLKRSSPEHQRSSVVALRRWLERAASEAARSPSE